VRNKTVSKSLVKISTIFAHVVVTKHVWPYFQSRFPPKKFRTCFFLVLGVTHSSHFCYWALPVPVRSFTGPRTGTGLYARGPISGTGLFQFRYGHSLGPVPELDSMRVVPFPVRGSASSGTVIHWAPYRNWTLCARSHFQRSKEECGSASLLVLVSHRS
jgi:hypothetical protein